MVPQPQISHEMVYGGGVKHCPESGSLSGFTFVNFVLSAIAVGANIVSNANREILNLLKEKNLPKRAARGQSSMLSTDECPTVTFLPS